MLPRLGAARRQLALPRRAALAAAAPPVTSTRRAACHAPHAPHAPLLQVRPKLITMPARKEKQLRRKEAKAEAAAQLETAIEKELLARLQVGDRWRSAALGARGAWGRVGAFVPRRLAVSLLLTPACCAPHCPALP